MREWERCVEEGRSRRVKEAGMLSGLDGRNKGWVKEEYREM